MTADKNVKAHVGRLLAGGRMQTRDDGGRFRRSYTLRMPVLCLKFLAAYSKAKDAQGIVRIQAAKIDVAGSPDCIKLYDDANNLTGCIRRAEIAGWWIEDDPRF